MTSTKALPMDVPLRALRRAAIRASLAPSILNTQPWHFELRPNRLDILAEPDRQLHVMDPERRQLTMSIGCALFNARVALCHDNLRANVERLPDALGSRRYVTIEVAPGEDACPGIGHLDPAIDVRESVKGEFVAGPAASAALIRRLQAAAEAEGATLVSITRAPDRKVLIRLNERTDAIHRSKEALLNEMLMWGSSTGSRRDRIIRGFAGEIGPGWAPIPVPDEHTAQQRVLLLCIDGDDPESWLRAGEALERVLLEAAAAGFTAAMRAQMLEVEEARYVAREELRLPGIPQMMLRFGKSEPQPRKRRRRLVDLITEID